MFHFSINCYPSQKIEWPQVFSIVQDTYKDSNRSKIFCGLEDLNSNSNIQYPQVSFPGSLELFRAMSGIILTFKDFLALWQVPPIYSFKKNIFCHLLLLGWSAGWPSQWVVTLFSFVNLILVSSSGQDQLFHLYYYYYYYTLCKFFTLTQTGNISHMYLSN